jgi:predicted TIM-barrel fold metal-dependent hydrolase
MKTSIEHGSVYRGTFVRSNAELDRWYADAMEADVLEPELPIVDAHHHLFGTAQDRLFYRSSDLHRDLDGGHRVIGTVYCEAYRSGWHSEGPEALRSVGEVQALARLTETPLQLTQGACQVAAGVVSHVDMTLGNATQPVLEAHISAAKGRLRGIRHRTATVGGGVGATIKDQPKPGLLRDADFRRGVEQVHALGLSLDVWVYHSQLPEVVELADAMPDTAIVINHIGAPIGVAEYREVHGEVLQFWKRQLHELSKRPNVALKLGGLGMPVFGFGFENAERPATAPQLAPAWRPYIETCLHAFGSHRCLFESNYPVDRQTCSYTELWNAFKSCTRDLSNAERYDLFYRTACRVYRLPELRQLGDSLCGSPEIAA